MLINHKSKRIRQILEIFKVGDDLRVWKLPNHPETMDLLKDRIFMELSGSDYLETDTYVGVGITETDPIWTLNTNILGTKNILESCKKNNIKKVILASSSEVYGEPKKVPIDETQTPMPITTYGISKLACEEYLKSYAKTYGFDYSVLRFFNVVGPKQSSRFVMPEFVNNALNNKPLVIHGDGLQIRAFCHIEDVCQGIEKSLSKGDGDTLNVGNDLEPISCIEDPSCIGYVSIVTIGVLYALYRFLTRGMSRKGRREALWNFLFRNKTKKN